MLRLFFAYPLPAETKSVLIRNFNSADYGIRFTKTENLHITQYFVGNVDEAELPGIIRISDEVFKIPVNLRFEFNGYNYHPASRPSMIWAGFTEKSGMFQHLAEILNDKFSYLASGNFHENPKPHITLARIRRGKEKIAFLNWDPLPVLTYDRCELWSSKNSPEGVVYTSLREFSFR